MQIGVIGAGVCSARAAGLAYDVGRLIAENGAVLVCGGLGGVMEHAARGAYDAGGVTVGILPGFDMQEANPYIQVMIPTGLSHARNVLVVRSSQAVIAIEGSYGTLSEIAFALKLGKPVIGLSTWDIGSEIIAVETARDAVSTALSTIHKRI